MKKTILAVTFAISAIVAQAQVTNGLVAKYSFNGGNANDEVGNNNGVITGATLTTDRFGKPNSAYSFDGVNDHIDFGDSSEFRMGTSDFTISIWVKYMGPQFATILEKRDGGSANFTQYSFGIMDDPMFGGISPNTWHFSRSSTSSDRSAGGGNLANGAWHHVVINHNYASGTSVYVDNNLINTSTATVSGNYDIANMPFVLGYSAAGSTSFFNGELDDLRIYKRSLTDLEIDSLYKESTNGLMAKYTFNNGFAEDESGYDNHGTASGPLLTTDRFGNTNHAYKFNGANMDKITVPNASQINFKNTDDFTIAYWMKISPDNGSNGIPLAKQISNGSWNGYSFLSNNTDAGYCNGQGKFTFYTASGAFEDACADSLISNNTSDWQFVTGVYKGANSRSFLYINGVLQADSGARSGNLNTTSDLTIGKHSSSNLSFTGDLDDIMIFGKALTQAQIDSLYTLPNPVTGIKDTEENSRKLTIYPTPLTDLMYIDGIVGTSAMLKICSVDGKIVFEKQVKNNQAIETANFPKGMYFVEITETTGYKLQSKVIKY